MVRLREHLQPILLLSLFAYLAIMTAWISDDSLIILRQVYNTLNGAGISWNPGERVQAFTHPSWFLTITFVAFFTGELFYTTLAVSITLSLGAILFIILYDQDSNEKSSHLVLIAALLALACSKAFTDFMTSGLENPLSYALIGFILWKVQRISGGEDTGPWSLAALYLAIALTVTNRFDYALLLSPLALFLFVTQGGVKKIYLWLPGAFAMLSWLGFATVYFGSPLPNTFYAKLMAEYPANEVLEHGASYLLVTTTHDPATSLLILAGLVAGFTGGAVQRCVAGGMLIYLGYIVYMGGDFMMGRFLAVPAFIAVFLILPAARRLPRLAGAGLVIYCIAVLAGPKPILSTPNYRIQTNMLGYVGYGVADERGQWFRKLGLVSPQREWPDIGSLSSAPPDRYTVRCGGIGGRGLRTSGIYFIDRCGLTDAFIARLPAIHSTDWRTGHPRRHTPTNYGEYKLGQTSVIADARLQPLLEDVQLAVTGELFSLRRLEALYRLNISKPYEFDKSRYKDPDAEIKLSTFQNE
jgi:arabinofuranosyltransferase